MTRAVFLDRDGTLVEEVPYLHQPERVVLLPGAARPAPPAVPVMPDLPAAAAAVLDGDHAAGPRRRRPPGWPCPSRAV